MATKKTVKPTTAAQKLNAFGIDLVCERTALCVPQREIAKEIGVSWATFRDWLNADSNRVEQYARAREAQADKMAEDILSLADKCRLGKKITTKANGDIEAVTSDMVERARLQIDARKWLAGKMAPKKYGDRQQVDVNDVTPRSIDDVRARLAELLSKANAPH